MAELREDIKAVLTAASHLVELTSISVIHEPPPGEVRRLIMSLPDRLTVDVVRRAIVGLEQAVSAWGAKSQEAIESTDGVLEVIPTRPLDVELRQWALERVECMPLYQKMDITTALWVANIFFQYAMNGAGPPDAPLPEDPA